MSSHSLARKYRPQNFAEVVGQATTVQILTNALLQKKLHPAYLFSGPRGIGKTSLARILAKAINCQNGPTPTPCNECVPCREIREGNSLAVIEIDGASNTSVDDVRELREKVRYLAPGGRYKIYIIDEVHMLSTAAFNALLKTLEEPPPHVLFLFATTESQKVPSTVLSRLIRFDLSPIPQNLIVDQLKKILGAESVQAEEKALFLIARESGGGLRDALSLLDQILSYSGAQLTVSAVEAVVGKSPTRFVDALLKALLEENSEALLTAAESANQAGIDAKKLAQEILEALRHLLVSHISSDPLLFDLSPDEIQKYVELSRKASFSELDRLFMVMQRSLPDLLRSPVPKILLDVLLLRLCHLKGLVPVEEIFGNWRNASVLADPSVSRTCLSPTFKKSDSATGSLGPEQNRGTEAGRVSQKSKEEKTEGLQNWPEFLRYLQSHKPQIYSLVTQGQLVELKDNEVILSFAPQSFAASLIEDQERKGLLEEQLKNFFKKPIRAQLMVENKSHQTQAQTPIINEAISLFNPQSTRMVGSKP